MSSRRLVRRGARRVQREPSIEELDLLNRATYDVERVRLLLKLADDCLPSGNATERREHDMLVELATDMLEPAVDQLIQAKVAINARRC